MRRPRVLFIDAYDSFSNNIISLLEVQLSVDVVKISIDTLIEDLKVFLRPFHAIVCGPGPGHPAKESDVGLFTRLWALDDDAILPILGICLGFQSLALYFGGNISQLERPRHGLVTDIFSLEDSIFSNIPHARAVQYHSLHVSLGHDLARGDNEELWKVTEQTPDLIPLAWDILSDQEAAGDANPTAILMSVKHRSKPFCGIQFHPESICSEDSARAIVGNWWSRVQDWWKYRERRWNPRKEAVLSSDREEYPVEDVFPPSSAHSTATSSSRSSSPASTTPSIISSTSHQLHYVTQKLGNLTVPRVCELLNITDDEVIVLDSEMRPMEGLGESSIIGIIDPDTIKVSYHIGASSVVLQTDGTTRREDLYQYGGDVFLYLKAFLANRALSEHPDNAFCGGFMGYVTYEAAVETIDILTSPRADRPGLCFAFIERSIVLDHVHQELFIQSLKPADFPDENSWLAKTTKTLATGASVNDILTMPPTTFNSNTEIYRCKIPSKQEYCAKIDACQRKIRAGESYELCLTNQTEIKVDGINGELQRPWERYRTQRQLNRAPFAAYVRLGPLTLLSTSPERFLRWSRPAVDYREDSSGQRKIVSTCQFRPIKGTVRKWERFTDGSPRKVTLDEAIAILSTPKERAENLMILDLIRHDLHGVAGSGNVSVPALMVVEEYETVYQLVSVIEGRLSTSQTTALPSRITIGLSSSHPANDDLEDEVVSVENPSQTGIDVLAAALPPGSMTGAPKRRACRLLQEIEQRSRSIYSGVVGYMCVTGKADFSVVIRSAFRWDDESVVYDGRSSETWYIGAGGAITDLSTEQGEWEEMLTKLQGTVQSFAPGAKVDVFA